MVRIDCVFARQIIDSRGNPTIEVEVHTPRHKVRAAVPSGASTGMHEALELRDGGKAWHGKGVSKAIRNVAKIEKNINKGTWTQQKLDSALNEIDGTDNKSNIGANAILGISMAFARAAAADKGIPLYEYLSEISGRKPVLPVPVFNVINGGKHAGTPLKVQEFMLIPVRAKSFSSAVQMGSEIYYELKALLKKRFGPSAVNVGDEGGFVPPFTCVEEPMDFLCDAIENAGYGKEVCIGMDAAASTFYSRGRYDFEGRMMSTHELLDEYARYVNDYPVVSIEDPFEENDFDGFAELTKKVGRKAQIVGDDLLCTNPARVQNAIRKRSCNALLLKPNQVGTISEALLASQLVVHSGWRVMASHRSGDTEDPFIADLAVGFGCSQIKSGAPCRGERTSKYNQLLRIEEDLGRSKYARW